MVNRIFYACVAMGHKQMASEMLDTVNQSKFIAIGNKFSRS